MSFIAAHSLVSADVIGLAIEDRRVYRYRNKSGGGGVVKPGGRLGG